MIDIKEIKHGDLVILSTGEEAVADGIIDYNEDRQRYQIQYNKPVTGWPKEKQWSWWYNGDGTFVTASSESNKGCADIVKVVKHGSIETEG